MRWNRFSYYNIYQTSHSTNPLLLPTSNHHKQQLEILQSEYVKLDEEIEALRGRVEDYDSKLSGQTLQIEKLSDLIGMCSTSTTLCQCTSTDSSFCSLYTFRDKCKESKHLH
jgi:hypothetical protein